MATGMLAVTAVASWTGARAELRQVCAGEAGLLTTGPHVGGPEERAVVEHLRRCGVDIDLPDDGDEPGR